MPKPILAALDPEHDDDAPLLAGDRLASVAGAPLMLVGAYLHDPITNAVSAGTVDADLRADVLRTLESRVGEADADLVVVGGSSPARALQDAAVQFNAQLLIVGSTHRGPLGRVVPGSTADRLLHGSPCPVLVTPAGLAPDWEPRRIGAGYIDLDDGRAALRVAAGLARAVGRPLRAVMAVEPLDWSGSAGIAPYGAGGADESRRIARRELDAAIAQLPHSAEVRGEVVVAQPAEVLTDLTGELDLLICGSRGYGPLRAVFLGGVTHAVLRKAQCPVLIVPRGADDALADLARRSETTAT